MADQELDDLGRVFDLLYDVQNRTWLDPRQGIVPKRHVRDVYEKLKHTWCPMPKELPDRIRRQLGAKAKQPATCSLADQGCALYLPPPPMDESILPIVSFEVARSIQDEGSSVVLKPRLLLIHCERPQAGKDMSPPHAIGFRFDHKDSAHPYCHSQVCLGLAGKSSKESDLLTLPCWLPGKIPALPLRAKGAIGLLLCLLVSLYGIESDVIKGMSSIRLAGQALKYIEEAG